MYELEHALFAEMKERHKGSSHLAQIIVPSARAAAIQGIAAAQIYKINLVDVSAAIIQKQLQNVTLQSLGIMAADSLHIATAIDIDAEIIISTDIHMHKLDGVFENSKGSLIRCVDTDGALSIL